MTAVGLHLSSRWICWYRRWSWACRIRFCCSTTSLIARLIETAGTSWVVDSRLTCLLQGWSVHQAYLDEDDHAHSTHRLIYSYMLTVTSKRWVHVWKHANHEKLEKGVISNIETIGNRSAWMKAIPVLQPSEGIVMIVTAAYSSNPWNGLSSTISSAEAVRMKKDGSFILTNQSVYWREEWWVQLRNHRRLDSNLLLTVSRSMWRIPDGWQMLGMSLFPRRVNKWLEILSTAKRSSIRLNDV